MRIRSIRPEFWSSEDIAGLTWDQRLIFIGLWSYVDDNGVGRDVDRLIVADLFPLDEDMRGALKKVQGALTEYSNRNLITRYEVDGKPYLHITTFLKHQVINRPSRGRYPLPTSADAKPQASLTDDSVSPHAKEVIGEGEKGRRGEEELPSSATADAPSDPFDEWWAHYPKKVEKIDARKAWGQVLRKGAKPEELIAAVKGYPFPEDKQFVKHPAVWLRKGAWQDHEQPTLSLVGSMSTADIDRILGPDMWRCPQPPSDLNPDQMWQWEQQVKKEHRAERVRQAHDKLGRSA
ncbi:MAG: hypothetical protein ACXVGF_04625 [Blastococcus sp.]